MEIREFQDLIARRYKARDQERGVPRTFMWFVEEVGELARIMSRTYGDQSFKKSDESYNLADELADVLFVLICIANQTGVDLTDALERNLEKKTGRDRDRHRENPKLTGDAKSCP